MSAHLALVACLDETRSVHTVTFKRAISLFQQYRRQHGMADAPITCYDDQADAETAARVAHEIVVDAPRAVIGHFASAAAAAAAPIYAQAGMPLLLPAATARALTRHATTYRICAHDDAYIAALRVFCASRQLRIARLEHDGSVHGRSIARALQGGGADHDANQDADQGANHGAPGPACVVFSGTCQRAIAFLAGQGETDVPVVLTDDALCQEIVAPAQAYRGEVYIVGLAPAATGETARWLEQAYRRQFGAPPGTYFWETIAAIEVALASGAERLDAQAWDTVLGPLRFDAEREAGINGFASYRVDGTGLLEIAA